MESKIVTAIYSHIEFYPPSINAIQQLSNQFNKIVVINSIFLKNEFPFNKNVELRYVGKYTQIRDFEKETIFKKILHFMKYVFLLKKNLKNAELFIAYDSIPLLAYKAAIFFSPFNKKPILWYHNHDVNQPGLSRKYSIAWFAAKNEPKMFKYLDIFTLPAVEREKYFPLSLLKGKYYFLPNYPSLQFFNLYKIKNKAITNEIKLVYQGSIGPGHGLEEIITILNEKIEGLNLTLHLKGFISEFYKLELIKLARINFVENRLYFYGVTTYYEVPKLASSCHIGIGIHTGSDIMNTTLGTSSNKIYEYAALGLPVLIFENKHFKSILGNYKWVEFTDLSKKNLIQSLIYIVSKYSIMSQTATVNFENQLNYEIYFNQINLN